MPVEKNRSSIVWSLTEMMKCAKGAQEGSYRDVGTGGKAVVTKKENS